MHGSSKRTYKTPKNSEFSSNTNMAAGGEDIDPLDEEEGFYDDFQDNLNSGKQSINVHNAAGVGSSAQHSPPLLLDVHLCLVSRFSRVSVVSCFVLCNGLISLSKIVLRQEKMVWEILVRELKNKIEMQWSDISAIRVSMHDNKDGILQIQLNTRPSFFGETNPQPRKHTIWQISSDFTQGQASIFRIHTILFPPGVLNSHYEKLLSCDRRLLELSHHFQAKNRRISTYHLLNFPLRNEWPRKQVMIYTVGNQEIDWRNISVGIGGRQHVSSQAQDNMAMITSGNYHPVATTLNNIEEYLLGDHSQVAYHDESTIATHVPSMCSTMLPIDDPFQSQMDYRTNHTTSTSQGTMLDENESYNVQRLYGFRSQAMNGLLSPPPPPPPTPNDPIMMGPEVNNVVPSLMPNNSADAVLYRFMPHGNPTNKAAIEASTSDGLTVEGIIANNWVIYDENESDWKSHAAAIAQSIHLIRKRLRWKKLIPRLEILSEQLNKPDLWDDPARAGKISREHGSIMVKMKEVNAFEQELFEHIDMIKLAREENDAELESESLQALLTLRRNIKEKELKALLSGEHDPCSCFIEVQAGAGGTESMDWASMVMQMYVKWAEGRGFGVTVVDEMPGELAGIKRATIKVDGEYAFGYAKAEVGSHRLVRISPFDSSVAASEKASAMAVLQSRLDQLEMERQAQINAEHTQSLTDINFGSQIRSYVLHPYRMVKDHRTDYEVSDPDSVLQGDLDGFILSYLSASLDKNEDEGP
ncbi:Peptide chain release factor PrfB2, chloroplastic [Sesamum angolense]|uniref:Peptide chain release factor PrfB2, chloroplastic n=1 Tax=Sesamum angolense TaxID=2727404 RepID=A0AAE1X7K1_9LAMI|nr:Peptide chain release factor PrfB2, chloroplastic [Sesamum angolense]